MADTGTVPSMTHHIIGTLTIGNTLHTQAKGELTTESSEKLYNETQTSMKT